MVVLSSCRESGERRTITVRPNRSLSWRQTKTLLLFFACVLSMVALYFWQLGAWMVMPFLGVELMVIVGAFYFHCLRSSRGESIEFGDEKVWIETREGRAGFSRPWVQVRLVGNSISGHPRRLIVGAHGRFLQIGSFLHDGEKELLAAVVEETATQRA